MPNTPRRFRFPRLFWLRDANSVDDEFAHHLAMREAELVSRGVAPAAARAEALRQFGDTFDARAYCESLDAERHKRARLSLLIDEIRQDAHYAVRQITRYRGHAAASISVLALGLALFITAIGIADAYLLRGLPFPHADRIVSIRSGPTAEMFPRMPDLQNVDWQVAARGFDGVVTWDLDGFTVMGGEHPQYIDGAWVSPDYFSVLGVAPALGRAFDSAEYRGAARVAIISDAVWKQRFGGDTAVIGTAVRMFSTDRPTEQDLVTIVGVLPRDAWHINRFTGILRPLTTPQRMFYLARLPAGATLDQAEAQLNAAVRPQVSNPDPAWSMSILPLHDEYVREARPAIVALVVGAALTLLVAITNVAGMAAVRSTRRRGEFALRAALGAGQGRIARQAVVESTLLTGVAAALGLVGARALLGALGPGLEERLGISVPGGVASLGLDWQLVTVVFPVIVVAALITAWRATRVHRGTLHTTMRPGESAGVRHARLRNTLMGAQIALTFALLTGAALTVRSAWHMTHLPLGFDPSNVYLGVVLLPSSRFPDAAARTRALESMTEALAHRPDVAVAAAVWPPPFWGGQLSPLHTEQSQSDGRVLAASERYFEALAVPLREGRLFSNRDDGASEPVAVAGERLARSLWPAGGAVGSRIRVGTAADAPWRRVVGVVADTRSSLDAEQPAELYIPLRQSPRAFLTMLVKWKGTVAGNATGVRQALASVDESLALSNDAPLSVVVARQTARQRGLSWLLVAFSSFGLLLSAIGLASSLAHGVAQRRPELALRLALGASPTTVFGMIVRDAAVLVGVAVAAGALLSFGVARILAAQLQGVSIADPTTYVGIALLVAAIAFVAAIIPARRAATLDPATTLRAL